MYSHEKKFYEKIYVKKKTGKGEDDETIVNLHDEFDEFARRDTPVSFLQLFCGTFTLFFIKIITSFCFAINLSRKLYKKIKEKEDKKRIINKRGYKIYHRDY
jgi:Na+/H+ antiporter NhaB